MGVKTVRFSDISGEEIDGDGATIRLVWHDSKRRPVALDVTKEEAEELAKNGSAVPRRRRRAETPTEA